MRLLTVLLCLLLASAYAKTSLWTVSNGKETLYIGGTIHVLRESDYPLPHEFDAAYKKADAVALETDIGEAENPEFGRLMLEKLAYPKGQSLRNDLKRTTYAQLKEQMAAEGLKMKDFEGFRIPMAVMALMGAKLEKKGMNRSGVDRHYFERARSEGKRRYFLESLDEQAGLIAGMGRGNEDAMTLQALEEIKSLDIMFAALTAAWQKGDEEKLYTFGLEPMACDYPQLYEELIKERNDAWMGYLVPMMKRGETVLVLVGALHLVGKDGLLAQFRRLGYVVEPYVE